MGIMGKIGIMSITALLTVVMMVPEGGMAQSRNSGKGLRKSGLTGNQRAANSKATYQSICQSVWAKYMDSLKMISQRADSMMSTINIDASMRQDLLRNPYYFPLFVSPMVYRSALRQEMGIHYDFGATLRKRPLHVEGLANDSNTINGLFTEINGGGSFRTWSELGEKNATLAQFGEESNSADAGTNIKEQSQKSDSIINRQPYPRYDYSDKRLEVNRSINAFLTDLYVLHPNLVQQTDAALEKQKSLPLDIEKEQQYRNTVSQRVAPARPMDVMEPIVAVSRKPNFWKFTGKVSLKMMQNYNSDNWYQGAVNNSSVLWKSFFTMNYNNKEKFHWDNSLEFNLGFQSDRNDNKHKYKTNTDLLRIINSVGLQASGHWYYSVSLTSWTQVYPKYNNNSDYVYSDFMSPFESVLSIGMEYKKSARRWNINMKPSPLSYDFKYCDRKALYSRYGIKGNKHTQEKFGSSLTCTFNWQILNELRWRSYLYTYTNYKSSLVQWENTFNFQISKHLSTEVFIYPRFDDSYHSSKSDAKIQLREYISLGFDYTF